MDSNFRRKIRVLGYPRADTWDPANLNEAAHLILFLENRYIRELPVASRSGLGEVSDQWENELTKYLEVLGCPYVLNIPFSMSNLMVYIQWLVTYSTSLKCDDESTAINSQIAKQLEMISKSENSAGQFILSESGKNTLHSIAEMCNVNVRNKTTEQILVGIHRCLRMLILPAIEAKRSGKSTINTVDANSVFEIFDAGVHTGNDTLDKAITVIRMLYIADLRELQDTVNIILSIVQDQVANPITDAKLGVVGR